TLPEAASRTQSRLDAWIALQRVREVARRDKRARFTALLHHVTVDLLRDSFYALKRGAAPGVDGLTWEQYEADLEDRLADLHRRGPPGCYPGPPAPPPLLPQPAPGGGPPRAAPPRGQGRPQPPLAGGRPHYRPPSPA